MNCRIVVHPIAGEIFRFYVEPQTVGTRTQYLVDLEELKGNGQCSCPDFQFHKMKQYNERLKLPPFIRDDLKPLHCKHIEACRNFFVDRSIKVYRENEGTVRDAMAAARNTPRRLEYIKKSDHITHENSTHRPASVGMAHRRGN